MEENLEFKDDIEAIGARIREIRLHLKLKLSDIANASGLSVSYLSDIELGRKRPHIDLILFLARTYNVDLNYLFLGTGKMFPAKYERTVKSREFDFQNEIDSIETFCWLMEHSMFFRTTMMSHASKLLLEEESLLKASIQKNLNK